MILREMSDMSAPSNESNIYGPLDDRLAQRQNKTYVDAIIEVYDEVGLAHEPGRLRHYLAGYSDEDGMPVGLLNTIHASETYEEIYRGQANFILKMLPSFNFRDTAPGRWFSSLSEREKQIVLMNHLAKYVGDKGRHFSV